jgi:hypothetical protein
MSLSMHYRCDVTSLIILSNVSLWKLHRHEVVSCREFPAAALTSSEVNCASGAIRRCEAREINSLLFENQNETPQTHQNAGECRKHK